MYWSTSRLPRARLALKASIRLVSESIQVRMNPPKLLGSFCAMWRSHRMSVPRLPMKSATISDFSFFDRVASA